MSLKDISIGADLSEDVAVIRTSTITFSRFGLLGSTGPSKFLSIQCGFNNVRIPPT